MKLDLIQASAIDKLSQLRAGALFMKMGMGKTRVAVELIKSKLGYIDYVIWLAPASLLAEDNYLTEVRKRAGSEAFKLFRLFTIESVSQSDTKYLEMVNLAKNNRVFCVVDESSKIKNIDSKRTVRLLQNYELFDFRLILNGTPTTRSILDLLPQINFLSPKILNMTEAQFANKFMEYYKDSYMSWRRWSKPANEAALVEILRPYIFDADLDIPVKLTNEIVFCELSAEEVDEYVKMKDQYLEHQILGIDFLAMVQKFQHKYTMCESKYKQLDKILARYKDEQILVFVKFLDEIDQLLELVPDSAEYSGRTKAKIKDFESGKYRVLISTYGTGSLGLNLQFCSKVIFFSQTFDYKDKIQALHRVYRTGQTKDVLVYDVYTNTGLEDIIRDSLDKKEQTLENIKALIKEKGVQAL